MNSSVLSENLPFIDLQLNGCYGVDFNSDDYDEQDLHNACSLLSKSGVEGILATVITDHPERMESRIRRLVQMRSCNEMVSRIIMGIHIEGPFINPTQGFVGAHPVDAVCPANLDLMLRLLDAADGLTKIVTLAPEFDGDYEMTKRLSSEGVTVSAGHCNPTTEQLQNAIENGLTMFTHIGNGCPELLSRHDNIINRYLSFSDKAWCCFIADGIHIPFFVLANYLKIAGIDRTIIVSDGIAAAGLGIGTYTLGGQTVIVDEGGKTTIAGKEDYLAGSVVTMKQSAINLREELGLSEEEIHRVTYINPMKVIAGRN